VAARFADYTYEQDQAYAAAGARRVGAQLRLLAVRDGTEPVGAAAIRIRRVPGLGRGIAYISSGPMLLPDAASGPDSGAEGAADIRARIRERAAAVFGVLGDRLVQREGHLLRFRLAATAGVPGGLDAPADFFADLGYVPTDRAYAYRTVLVDLARDEAALQKAMHSKWRYELRRAAELEIAAGRDRSFVERFLALYGAMRDLKSFEGVDPAFLRGMVDTGFGFEVRIARYEGADVAGHVTAFTPRCATYLFGATTETGRALRAGYRLMWSTMLAFRARGARWYDLGGIDRATNPAGHQFKTRTGGSEILAPGPFERGSGIGYPLLRGIEAAYAALRRAR
jgi:lipid II:glycine glycyltransferase (peptidoglycan interpeptide bridge formation enzyme)